MKPDRNPYAGRILLACAVLFVAVVWVAAATRGGAR